MPSAITTPSNPNCSRRISCSRCLLAWQNFPSISLYAAIMPFTPASQHAFAACKWISHSSLSPIRAALALTPPVVSPCAQKCFATTATPSFWIPVTIARASSADKYGSSSLRPHLGSLKISSVETSAKSTPICFNCLPHTCPARSYNAGSNDAPTARLTGSRYPSNA